MSTAISDADMLDTSNEQPNTDSPQPVPDTLSAADAVSHIDASIPPPEDKAPNNDTTTISTSQQQKQDEEVGQHKTDDVIHDTNTDTNAATFSANTNPQDTETNAEAINNDDDDEFGDFDDFESAPIQDTTTTQVPTTISQPAAAPQTVSAPLTIDIDTPTRDADIDTKITDIMKRIGMQLAADPSTSILDSIYDTVHRAWGIPSTSVLNSTSDSDQPISIVNVVPDTGNGDAESPTHGARYQVTPNTLFSDAEWTSVWKFMSSDPFNATTVASDGGGDIFRWRRSVIRKGFIESIQNGSNNGAGANNNTPATSVPQQPQPVSATVSNGNGASNRVSANTTSNALPQQADTSKNEVVPHLIGFAYPQPNVYDKMDPLDADLLESKRLCDISEDEMRKHSVDDLKQFIQVLQSYTTKLQDQSNYWLDAKEQLVMDAEMHNKMIGSLVQYAQQQQQQLGVANTQGANGSKKKRVASVSKK